MGIREELIELSEKYRAGTDEERAAAMIVRGIAASLADGSIFQFADVVNEFARDAVARHLGKRSNLDPTKN